MSDEGLFQEERPYKGVAIVCFVLLFVPALVFFICRGILRAERFSELMRLYEALFFGGAVGTVFCLSFILCGGFTKSFRVVKSRIREFFENLPISFSFACKCYFDNLSENGFAFWLYFICLALNVAMALIGGLGFARLYLHL